MKLRRAVLPLAVLAAVIALGFAALGRGETDEQPETAAPV